MEEAKLQLSHLYWTTSSLADRIAIFQRFLNIDNTVTKEKQNNYTKFDIKGKNISIQIIFLDNAEVVPTKFDTDIFKLIFLPNGTSQEVVDKITGETSTFAFLFEDDINSIIKGLKVEELSLYKVFYHFIKSNSFESKSYDQDDIQRFYQNSLKRNVHLSDFEFATVIDKLSLENHPRNNVKHRKTTQLLNEIRKDGVSNIILNGKSASGKTTFTFTIADELTPNFQCYYIESTILDDEVIAGLAIDLIKNLNENNTPVLLIADDLQSNLDGARKLIHFLNYLQAKFGGKRNISFVGIIWDDFTYEIKHQFKIPPVEISISASDLIENLISGRCTRSLSKNERELLEAFADNNLFILSLAIKFLNEDATRPISDILVEIPELVFNDLILKATTLNSKFELEKLFFCLSLFGQYEIDLTTDFLIAMTNSNADFVAALFSKQVIRKRGNGITLGHKSYSRIIFEFLQKNNAILQWYQTQKRLIANSDFILEFLKGLQPNQIYSILKKLYENSKSITGSTIIINTWLSIDKILGKILFHQKIDSTWNNNASSALFAIQTLDSFGFVHEAEKSIEFFRGFYSVNEAKKCVDVTLENLITVDDFKKIKECLIKQDETETLKGEKGVDIYENEFHKNWLSGVILSAEGFHKSLSDQELTKLATYIENQAIEGKYYYPERVSWCSSRVLIGLGLCKRNIHNSKVIAGVAEWLLNHPNYNEQNGYWTSGTGAWNHWFEATSLAISGLVSVGVPIAHPKIQRGIENLLANKNYFTSSNMELDGIFAIQTLSQADVNLFAVQDEIKTLSEWMTTKADWESIKKTSADTFKQSCQISQSAAGIVEVMWKMVREDLPTVVKAIDKKVTPIEKITIFVSYEWNSQAFALELVEELYSKYGKENVLFDLKDNNNISSTRYMEKINDVDITLYLCTKKYKEKADSGVGGVGSEAGHIRKGLYENRDRFIPILLEGDWKIEFMPNFWATTIGVTCLDSKLNEFIKCELHKLIKIKFSNNKKK
jgi:hypothetical protein